MIYTVALDVICARGIGLATGNAMDALRAALPDYSTAPLFVLALLWRRRRGAGRAEAQHCRGIFDLICQSLLRKQTNKPPTTRQTSISSSGTRSPRNCYRTKRTRGHDHPAHNPAKPYIRQASEHRIASRFNIAASFCAHLAVGHRVGRRDYLPPSTLKINK